MVPVKRAGAPLCQESSTAAHGQLAAAPCDGIRINSYWGGGWEDPAMKLFRFRALPVAMDDASAISPEYADVEPDDDFNWLAFEQNGGMTQVSGGVSGFVGCRAGARGTTPCSTVTS